VKSPSFVEAGALGDGTRVFRMVCPACNRNGAWLKELNVAERSKEIHDKHAHAEQAVA
jgi:hypothetical protein